MKTAVINLREHLVRCVGLPLVGDIPLALLLKYVCTYHSYLNLTSDVTEALRQFQNYLELELAAPPSSKASLLSTYAVGEPEKFIIYLRSSVQILSNRLYSALEALCVVSGMPNWMMIDFVDYNPISYTLVVRIN